MRQNDLQTQTETIKQTVDEISHINLIENQRMLQIENLQFEYQSKIDRNKHKMNLLINEKGV